MYSIQIHFYVLIIIVKDYVFANSDKKVLKPGHFLGHGR